MIPEPTTEQIVNDLRTAAEWCRGDDAPTAATVMERAAARLELLAKRVGELDAKLNPPVFDYAKAKADTMAALADPQVGDRFHEMYGFYVYVVAVNGDEVVTLEGSPPVTFPNGAIKRRTQTKAEFLKRLSYGSIPGSWVMLSERGNDVTGWEEATR